MSGGLGSLADAVPGAGGGMLGVRSGVLHVLFCTGVGGLSKRAGRVKTRTADKIKDRKRPGFMDVSPYSYANSMPSGGGERAKRSTLRYGGLSPMRQLSIARRRIDPGQSPGNFHAVPGGTQMADQRIVSARPECPQAVRLLQSSMALRMAAGARLLQRILYSGMPPSASATDCFGDRVGLFDRLAQHHLGGHGRTGNGHRASHALEFHFLDDVVFDAQGNQDGVAVERALDHRLAGRVGYAAHVARIGVMVAYLLAIQGQSPRLKRAATKEYDTASRMFSDLYTKAAELASQGQPFAIATVVRVEGSSSARRGSKALIDQFGKLLLGWVGGGCAESAVRSEALPASKPRDRG